MCGLEERYSYELEERHSYYYFMSKKDIAIFRELYANMSMSMLQCQSVRKEQVGGI